MAGLAILGTASTFISVKGAEGSLTKDLDFNQVYSDGLGEPSTLSKLQNNQPLGMLDDWFLFLPMVVKEQSQVPTVTITPTEEILPTATVTPTEPLTPTATHTPTNTTTPRPGQPRDGQWTGDAVTDGYPEEIQIVKFTLESGGSQIATGARIDTYYYVESGFWVCSGTVEWTVNNPISINPDGSFQYSGGIVDKLTWEGNFVTETSAQGTFHIEKQTYVCGKALLDGTWSAGWQENRTR